MLPQLQPINLHDYCYQTGVIADTFRDSFSSALIATSTIRAEPNVLPTSRLGASPETIDHRLHGEAEPPSGNARRPSLTRQQHSRRRVWHGTPPKYLEEMHGVKPTGLDVADFNATDIAFTVFDGVRIPFPDQSFDHVMLSFTLHHAHDPMTLIQECRRVARNSLLVFEDMPDNRYGRLFLKVHVELFRLYYKLRPVHDVDYRQALESLGNEAVNVVKVQMPSEWFAKEGGSLYRVPRFLLVYELSEPSRGEFSRTDLDANSLSAARHDEAPWR